MNPSTEPLVNVDTPFPKGVKLAGLLKWCQASGVSPEDVEVIPGPVSNGSQVVNGVYLRRWRPPTDAERVEYANAVRREEERREAADKRELERLVERYGVPVRS